MPSDRKGFANLQGDQENNDLTVFLPVNILLAMCVCAILLVSSCFCDCVYIVG